MKTFIVLGMHRSATSLIAKGLSNCLFIGKNLMSPSLHNVFGYYEDWDFVNLNDRILNEANGSWNNPPPEDKILLAGEKFSNEIKNLINLKNKQAIDWLNERKDKNLYKCPLWGWKDPRNVLTIKVYLPYISNPHFVCVFRSPEEVAKSLVARGDFQKYDNALALAKIYNKRLIDFLSNRYN